MWHEAVDLGSAFAVRQPIADEQRTILANMIDHQFQDSVLTVTLSRAPVNAINRQWLDEFHAVLDALVRRSEVAVVVIRSSERVFSAGADLKLMRDCFATAEGSREMVETTRRMQRLNDRIERLPQVTLAVIGGTALGGGFELALACDLRVAACEAQMGLPEAKLGLLPGAGGTQRLSRLCGPGVARRAILTGETFTGAQARELGMVQWAVDGQELGRFSDQLVERIGAMSPFALAACKQCLMVADGSSEHGMAVELHHTGNLLGHPDTRTRVSDFLKESGKRNAT